MAQRHWYLNFHVLHVSVGLGATKHTCFHYRVLTISDCLFLRGVQGNVAENNKFRLQSAISNIKLVHFRLLHIQNFRSRFLLDCTSSSSSINTIRWNWTVDRCQNMRV